MTTTGTGNPYALGPHGASDDGGYRDALKKAQSDAAHPASAANQRAYLIAAYQAALAQAQYRALYAGYGPLNPVSCEAAPKPAIEDAGIRAGEIVGWRVWKVRGGALGGIFYEWLWPFTEPVVTPESDVEDKGLGVFAFKTQQKCLKEYGSCAGHDEIVIGTVHLWGLVIEHERGYRAEFARPASFVAYLGPNWADGEVRLKALRKNYGLVEP